MCRHPNVGSHSTPVERLVSRPAKIKRFRTDYGEIPYNDTRNCLVPQRQCCAILSEQARNSMEWKPRAALSLR